MQLKDSGKQNLIVRNLKAIARFKILTGLLILLSYSALMILLGGNLHKEGFFGEVLKPLIQENIRIPGNYIKGILSEPEHLVIDIKHTDYQKLAYKRKVAISKGVLHPFKEDFVPAKIRWKGKTIKVNMRLKGDLGDHWLRDHKWSFRIKAREGKSVMGMSTFSLQHPRTRGFLNDWHLHKLLQQHGFIALRYDFVNVTINGRHLGIYAIEEHFNRQLIENNRHINGPIIRIKDHLLWYLADQKPRFDKKDLDELYSSSPIDAFRTNTVNQDEVLSENFKKAKNLLEAFRRGKLLAHEVFDIEKLAKIFAINDLWGYRHVTAYSNIRFYYNPVTSRLVPVGYDNTFIDVANTIEGQTKRVKTDISEPAQRLDWRATFFEDKIFFRKYIEALLEISKEGFLDEFFNSIQDQYEESLGKIYSTFPGYTFANERAMLHKNEAFIRDVLNPREGLQAYLKNIDKEKRILTFQVGNIQFLPLEIKDAYYEGKKIASLSSDFLLQSKTPFRPIAFREVRFQLPEGISLPQDLAGKLKLNYSVFGTHVEKQISVFNWPYYDDNFLETDFIRQSSNYRKFDILDIDDNAKRIYIEKGSWTIRENIIIPEGYTVVCREGTQLNFIKSAKLLTYSALEFVGTQQNPIIIKSTDSNGQGIAVINAVHKSTLKNVIVENLSSPSQSGWRLPGALTFYESHVDIENSRFIDGRSEANLSIIRSEFNISNSFFGGSFSDALSVVFAEGKISKTSIVNSKHDGLKILGSVVNIEDIYIEQAVNSGINAIARSTVNVHNVEILNTGTAVRSIDSSTVKLENAKITDSKLAFYAAQENQEYGPAEINVKNLSKDNVQRESIVENESTLLVN